MFETNQSTCELVLFWDGESIDKCMLFQDFEATLDSVVGIAAYANELKQAAYVQLDAGLHVRACALFAVRFEDDGFPVRSWNIPLRHMVEIAARGPDLGGGAIQLACRSQCPISWHATALWDPIMDSGFNTFEQIRREAEQAATRFGYRAQVAARPVALAVTDTDFPVLTDETPLAPPVNPAWEEEKSELTARLQEQQLHIVTLETDKHETITRLGYMHQQQVDILEAQNGKLMAQFKAMKAQSDAQREQIEALRNQLNSQARLETILAEENRLHEQQLAAAMQSRAGEEAEKFQQMLAQKEQEFTARESRWREEQRIALEQRMEEEASRHQLQLTSLLNELRERDETLGEVEQELQKLKDEQAHLQQSAADSMLQGLASLGMNFIVFQPGVGNMSVPVAELGQYMSTPVAYAAAKCLVTEEQYRVWLEHNDNPRCMAKIGDHKCCDARLIRVDSPSKFVFGQSDRCARHQSADTAIANVLRFR